MESEEDTEEQVSFSADISTFVMFRDYLRVHPPELPPLSLENINLLSPHVIASHNETLILLYPNLDWGVVKDGVPFLFPYDSTLAVEDHRRAIYALADLHASLIPNPEGLSPIRHLNASMGGVIYDEPVIQSPSQS